MDKKAAPFTWVDWLLIAAIVGLSTQLLVQLLGPTVEAWKNRPRPAMQVPQQYLVEQGSGADAMTIPVDYLLYLPPEYDNSRKWPLVVYLHGSGVRGTDPNLVRREGVAKQVESGKQYPFILVSPQCPPDSVWSTELIVAFIEHICSSWPVDRDRVYLTGSSMGGFGAWNTACFDPGRFAAIAPLCGGGDINQAERLQNVPVWAFHGENDKTVPLESGQKWWMP